MQERWPLEHPHHCMLSEQIMDAAPMIYLNTS